MKLKQTADGSWVKTVMIEKSADWKRCSNQPVPFAVAEAYLKKQFEKGRKAKIKSGFTCEDGQEGYEVRSYIPKYEHVLVFASPEDCKKKEVEPGPHNVEILLLPDEGEQ